MGGYFSYGMCVMFKGCMVYIGLMLMDLCYNVLIVGVCWLMVVDDIGWEFVVYDGKVIGLWLVVWLNKFGILLERV